MELIIIKLESMSIAQVAHLSAAADVSSAKITWHAWKRLLEHHCRPQPREEKTSGRQGANVIAHNTGATQAINMEVAPPAHGRIVWNGKSGNFLIGGL